MPWDNDQSDLLLKSVFILVLASYSSCLQRAVPLLVCMMGPVSWTVLTLITVPVWLVTQARDVKMVSV